MTCSAQPALASANLLVRHPCGR